MLSCGEGGLLATDDDDVAEQVAQPALARDDLRHLGPPPRPLAPSYDVVGLGFNYRMDEPRAALLLARLEGLEDDIAAGAALVHRYRELLADVPGLTVPYRTTRWTRPPAT